MTFTEPPRDERQALARIRVCRAAMEKAESKLAAKPASAKRAEKLRDARADFHEAVSQGRAFTSPRLAAA